MINIQRNFFIENIFFESKINDKLDFSKIPYKDNIVNFSNDNPSLILLDIDRVKNINYFKKDVMLIKNNHNNTILIPISKNQKKINNLINHLEKFNLNNSGKHERDFTYIKDVDIILEKLLKKTYKTKHEIFNICSGNTVNIKKIVKSINRYQKVKILNSPLHKADLLKTHGRNKKLIKFIGKINFTSIDKVLLKIFYWYKNNNIIKIT